MSCEILDVIIVCVSKIMFIFIILGLGALAMVAIYRLIKEFKDL